VRRLESATGGRPGHDQPLLRRLRRQPQRRITIETAELFGVLAAKLKKAPRDPNVEIDDLWLAAQAIQRKPQAALVEPEGRREEVR